LKEAALITKTMFFLQIETFSIEHLINLVKHKIKYTWVRETQTHCQWGFCKSGKFILIERKSTIFNGTAWK
jgi:hypothetical protein